MKTFLLLLCTTLFSFTTEKSFSQEKVKLDADKMATVDEVFNIIQSQTKLRFLYPDDLFVNAPKVQLKKGVIEVFKLLEQSLSESNVRFELSGKNNIVIKQIEVSAKPKTAQVQQKIKISGVVVDQNNQPLLGANVLEKGTTNGTIADFDGKFSIEVANQKSILVVSFIGFVAQEVHLNEQTNIRVVLLEDQTKLQEVVVVGYGTVKKKDLTGSVSSVFANDIVQYPVSGLEGGLQGRAAGVSVVQNSSAPGAPVNVRIRGSNSILGSNEPLYVVDGFALVGSPSLLNPNDIESMEILKDASSTAIYGSRGANGVILITTKSGKTGKNTITFENYIAFQEVSKTLTMMNAREFAEIANERVANDGGSPFFTQNQINSLSKGTNWQDELYRTAPIQNYSLSVSGGNEKTKYFFSGNLFDQEGIIPNSSLKKVSARGNVTTKINDKLKLSFNSFFVNQDLYANDTNGQKGGTTLSAALVAPPTISPYNSAGGYNNVRAYSFSPNELDNPLAMAKERKQLINSKKVILNSSLSYEPIKNLILKTALGVEAGVSRENYYSSLTLFRTPKGSGQISSSDLTNILNENTVTYSKKFNEKHDLNALVGFTYQKNDLLTYTTGAVTGFLTDIMKDYNLGAGSATTLPHSNLSSWALLSYLGRINYSYDDRYLFTVSLRADGSSRFSKGNKWGYFPSAAFAWKIMNEKFMEGLNRDVIDNLKLRLSLGDTGNTGIAPYQTLNTLRTYSTVFDDTRYIGFAPNNTNLANPDLKWERTSQINAGLDIDILKRRFSLHVDVYRKDTKDLLAYNQLPTSSGYTNTISNVGKIRNEGIELELSTIVIDYKDINWSLNTNFSKNISKVISLPGGSDIFGAQIPQPLAVSVNMLREDQPVGVFYGFFEDGLDEKGAIKYKDLNGDQKITAGDRTIIGNPNPDFTYNVQSHFSYKKFDFDFMFQGVHGADVFNTNLSSIANSFYFGENQLKEVYNNHWSPSNPNPNAKYPKISTKTTFSASDRFVENGSYLRLKNISLGYTISALKKAIDGKIYISVQNLFTFTDYSGYNPEVNTSGGSTSFSNGIDNLSYPLSKTYTMGVVFKF